MPLRDAFQRAVDRATTRNRRTATIGVRDSNGKWVLPDGENDKEVVTVTLDDGTRRKAAIPGIMALAGREITVDNINGAYRLVHPGSDAPNAATLASPANVGVHVHARGTPHFYPIDPDAQIDGGFTVNYGTMEITLKQKWYIDTSGELQCYPGGDTIDLSNYLSGLSAGEQRWVTIYIDRANDTYGVHEPPGVSAPADTLGDVATAYNHCIANVSNAQPYLFCRVNSATTDFARYTPAKGYDTSEKDFIRVDVLPAVGGIGDISDVSITSVADGDVPYYDSAAGTWQNTNLLDASQQVPTGSIADDAVTNAKIADDAVDTAQLATDSVGADALQSTIAQDMTFGDVIAQQTTAVGVNQGVDGLAGQFRTFSYRSSGSNRVLMLVSNQAESGSDAGSNFRISCYDDSGSFLGTALQITRSNQNVTVNNDLSVSGALSKGSGTFKIDHPIDGTKCLRHEMVEAPRADLIYRGKATLTNGTALVDVDAASNMQAGTLAALARNFQIFLQNNENFERVRGQIVNGQLGIESENANSAITVDWMVVAERADPFMKSVDYTDADGRVVPEQDKPGIDVVRDRWTEIREFAKAELDNADTPQARRQIKLRLLKYVVRGVGDYPLHGDFDLRAGTINRFRDLLDE